MELPFINNIQKRKTCLLSSQTPLYRNLKYFIYLKKYICIIELFKQIKNSIIILAKYN